MRSGSLVEEEPRLRYSPLSDESPRALKGHPTATRLGVSDKVLAVGHRDGRVQLLDHLGNQIRVFTEHSGEVTDLSFDAGAEFLASSSTDGSVVVYALYVEEVQRFKFGVPVSTVALDPRYGSRKTRELVYGTNAGCLALCSKGWLGNKETVLFQGKGTVRCARMSGTLLAWASDSGLRVYNTATHTRLGKLERPPSAAADPDAPCSMLWRSERELFVAWGQHVWVLRVIGSLLAPATSQAQAGAAAASGRSLQIVASFDAGCTVLGAAPFGAELALLTWGAPSAGSQGGSGRTAAQAGTVLPVGGSTSADEQAASHAAAGRGDGQQNNAATAETPAPSAVVDAATGAAQSGGSKGTLFPPPAAAEATAAGAAGAAAAAAAAAAADGQQATAAGTPQQAAASAQAQQRQQEGQQEGQLSLSFFTRGGQLLASDALGSSCEESERKWHQLALVYSGEADLQLASAVPSAVQSTSASVVASRQGTPRRSPAGSIVVGSGAGSGAGSVTGSGRSSPEKAGAPAGGTQQVQQQAQQQQQQPQEQQQENGCLEAVPVQQYQWWRDGEEPTYLMSGPQGVVVGRPRDGNDRVAWLSDRGRYVEALAVAEQDRSVQRAALEALGEQYLQVLVGEGQYSQAAALCPRVLKANALAWERWSYTFAQARQLAALAPLLPTSDPQLKSSTYDMVLASLLLHPAEHAVLLEAVRSWPQSIYDVAALQSAVLSRMGGVAGSWPVLQQVAAHLYTAQGRHEEALQLQLQMRTPAVFDYIARHALFDRLAPYAAALVDLDEVRATSLLVEHCEEVPPSAVVAALQDSASRAAEGEHRQRWRRRLHHYLDWLFHKDSQQGGEFAELQVELYAEYEPSRLLHFLTISPTYPLERAYQVCEARGLTREMVFVLGRMGSAEKALRLIVEGLRDVGQAVEFVQLQRDDELWEQLIALTLGDAQLTGALLDHAGGYIDPLRVVSQIPQHMKVDNLRERLVKIITDFRTQMCLQQGCNTILRHDCIVLANRLYRQLRSSLRHLHLRLYPAGGDGTWVLYDARSGRQAAEDDSAAALLGAPVGAAAGAPPVQAGGHSPGAGWPQQQQQQRVWVGFAGEALPAVSADQLPQAQQRPGSSPSKFVRLASGVAPSPGKSVGLPPRNLLVS